MHSLTKVHIHSTKHAERVLSTVSGEGGGDGGFIMLDFQARAAKRISQTYRCRHQAKYSTVSAAIGKWYTLESTCKCPPSVPHPVNSWIQPPVDQLMRTTLSKKLPKRVSEIFYVRRIHFCYSKNVNIFKGPDCQPYVGLSSKCCPLF